MQKKKLKNHNCSMPQTAKFFKGIVFVMLKFQEIVFLF